MKMHQHNITNYDPQELDLIYSRMPETWVKWQKPIAPDNNFKRNLLILKEKKI